MPLPATRFEPAVWKQATVQFNYHVAADKMYYSIRWSHAMKELSELFCICLGGKEGWFDPAEASGIPALAYFARRKRERIDGLANHARHCISAGKLEGFNNRIKVAKRTGYGYRDDDCSFTTIRYISIPDFGSLSPKKT